MISIITININNGFLNNNNLLLISDNMIVRT